MLRHLKLKNCGLEIRDLHEQVQLALRSRGTWDAKCMFPKNQFLSFRSSHEELNHISNAAHDCVREGSCVAYCVLASSTISPECEWAFEGCLTLSAQQCIVSLLVDLQRLVRKASWDRLICYDQQATWPEIDGIRLLALRPCGQAMLELIFSCASMVASSNVEC